MSVRVRIAPSPTGNLHIGTARTAVFNWLFARHQGGTFVLRIEDTDLERSRPEYTQNILDGLTWLGLTWDEGPTFQTKRMDLYRQKVQQLLDQGLAYRAYDTPEELNAIREAQKAQGQAPRYDNRHRDLTPEQEAAYIAEGRKPVIRFKIDDEREIAWQDLVRGTVTWKGRDLGGDMVIARAADADDIGQPLYNFVVVVDDIDMQISHVIRGEDHIGNTPKQILLYEALGATVPQFGHTPLILNQAGAKLSKRDGVTSISDFQKMGYTAEALANYMTLLGWSPPEGMNEIFSLEEAAQHFSFERVNKAGAKFDWDKLNWINSQYLHHLPVEQLTDLLIPYWQSAGYELDPVGDRAWLEQLSALIAPSLVRLEDAVAMTRYLFVADVGFTDAAANQLKLPGVGTALQSILTGLKTTELTPDTAQSLIQQGVEAAKVKKGVVMKSLRAALTGDLQGPELVPSWLLLNQHQIDQPRLRQALAVAESSS
ncbi:MAG: glutamate--tRNA ligase [Leptolyngbya sp. IPPAS B-1204]|uniref:Glutamate--tRNA ligase n=1 Tax=Leptolyngbya sp. NK1-12 TaxID=2547451 RepID=A0AA97AQK1_9CYAN|nr:glutamate--tRNA ligase [Leptolyngbya sp. NK1-12]MBF2048914.1 glutamate--tRNA ligase [Elainella sp. C42_A2020_010]RNJ69083.1 MAG: glutamate--tRNA ligase [Leptolyngbya sp. IPPAS B-1204]WNZ23688.1 glutamate--tRNA ligase [Leptolyngbya sp. NK1-12]